MNRILAILICFSMSAKGDAQEFRVPYCKCQIAKNLTEIKYPDSLYASAKQNSGFYSITIYNTTSDTMYLFSSYLQPHLLSSKYLHRVDIKRKQYKLSFLPIIPFVFTKYSDLYVFGSEVVVRYYQVAYDFIKMQPNSYYEFNIPIKDGFQRNDVIEDFPAKELNKYDYKTKFTNVSIDKVDISKYKRIFEFAIYNSVSLLCNESAYFLQENEFNNQAKNFKLIVAPVN